MRSTHIYIIKESMSYYLMKCCFVYGQRWYQKITEINIEMSTSIKLLLSTVSFIDQVHHKIASKWEIWLWFCVCWLIRYSSFYRILFLKDSIFRLSFLIYRYIICIFKWLGFLPCSSVVFEEKTCWVYISNYNSLEKLGVKVSITVKC